MLEQADLCHETWVPCRILLTRQPTIEKKKLCKYPQCALCCAAPARVWPIETSKVWLNVVMGLQCAVIYKDCPVSAAELELQHRRKGLCVLRSSVAVFLCLLSSMLGLLANPSSVCASAAAAQLGSLWEITDWLNVPHACCTAIKRVARRSSRSLMNVSCRDWTLKGAGCCDPIRAAFHFFFVFFCILLPLLQQSSLTKNWQ